METGRNGVTCGGFVKVHPNGCFCSERSQMKKRRRFEIMPLFFVIALAHSANFKSVPYHHLLINYMELFPLQLGVLLVVFVLKLVYFADR